MSTHLTKIWWDLNKHKLVEMAIPEAEIYKREWVGLTDEEIQDLSYLSQKIDEGNAAWFDRWGFAKAIEKALKEKNHG